MILEPSNHPQRSTQGLAAYFLKLGVSGFGGPIALVGAMHKDLVEERAWFSEDEYRNGLALAQLAPGPLAAQLAFYLGWVEGGVVGSGIIGVAFVLPSFLIVLALAMAYIRFGGLPWMQAAFYGVGAAVIAVIARSAQKLAVKTLKRDAILWTLFVINAFATAILEAERVWLVAASGLLFLLLSGWPKHAGQGKALSLAIAPWFVTGLKGPVALGVLGGVFLYFAQAGTFVFGSGLAIVPFLHEGVVTQNKWLTEQQFLDAVAVAMLTPGPVVITVAFIGYLVAGPAGAVLAALGTFLPCYGLTVLLAGQFSKWVKNPAVASFVQGVTAAATGAIAGSVYVLGKRAVHDPLTIGICLLSALLLWKTKVPEPLLLLGAAVIGALARAPML